MRITGYEMRAVGEPLVRSDREEARPGPGQVLVEVVGCGICHTDLGFLYDGVPTRHPLPLVLGHEIAGIVVEEGLGAPGLKGKAVVVSAVIPCGSCPTCRRGRGDICPSQVFPGNDVHGGFASHVVVPARGVCVVPWKNSNRQSLARLAVVADAVSTAYAAVKRAGIGDGDLAVVVGAGGVGGFCVQILRALGARVLAIDIDPERLLLVQSHGASWALDARDTTSRDLKKKVRDLAREHNLPESEWKIFEASGTAKGQETAFGLLTFGARLMVIGYTPMDVTVRMSNLMAFAARAEGVWGCLPESFPAVLDLVLEDKIALDPLIEFHPMSAIQDVFEKLRRHELKRRPVLLADF
jgi:6-hydroxycyclohex-1-ene-1-carbonyl-CoA dehydrogenase